jgi:acetylornithine deacetylase/succinyl-diaminopimelate desuccinylase-like protein
VKACYFFSRLNESDCKSKLKLGDVTTLNLTGLQGGLAANIVPDIFKATFDIRIDIQMDLKKFEQQLQDWIKESEIGDTGSITYEFIMGVSHDKKYFKF